MIGARSYRLALEKARRDNPGASDKDLDHDVDEILSDWARDRAEQAEVFGEPEDTPCLEDGRDNCDDWGTGEGRYHGRIG